MDGIYSRVRMSRKCLWFRHLAEGTASSTLATLLGDKVNPSNAENVIKIMTRNHRLKIETGSWGDRVPERERLCERCMVVEDECHLIFDCGKYADLRSRYIDMTLVQNYVIKDRLFYYISSGEVKTINNLGIFIKQYFKRAPVTQSF